MSYQVITQNNLLYSACLFTTRETHKIISNDNKLIEKKPLEHIR